MTEEAEELGYELAFPCLSDNEEYPGQLKAYDTGLTKREYFAGLAMQGICANEYINDRYDTAKYLAKEAVGFADALLEELSKTE